VSLDELLLVVLCSLGAFRYWAAFAGALRGKPEQFYPRNWVRRAGALAPSLLGVFVLCSLRFAATSVRDSPLYIAQYWSLGALLLAGVDGWLAPWLGLSFRDDVSERGNAAALAAWIGVMLAFTLAYVGSNLGEGPGYWVVLLCSALGFGVLALAWALLEFLADVADRITIERELDTGLRMAGLLAGLGLVTARGEAGDFQGAWPAVLDFLVVVGPALPFVLGGVMFERWLVRSRVLKPRATGVYGALPAVGFLLSSLVYVQQLGPW
jgi:hypothetical protein